MRAFKSAIAALAIALVLQPCTAALAVDPDKELTAMVGATETDNANLSPIALAIAKQLGVMPTIERLDQIKHSGATDLATEVERLKLKQSLNDKVVIATLQVRDATARIERQISILNRTRGLLEDKRDRAIKLNSMANVFAMGGLNEIGQAGEMKVNEVPGEIIELIAGGLTVVLGALALKQQSGGVTRLPTKPNMLAEVFNRRIDDDVSYPPIVWKYLTSSPPGTTETRLHSLIQRWQQYKVIGNPASRAGKRQIDTLTNVQENNKVTIDNLIDQASMLADVKAEVFQLDRDLLELLVSAQAL
jgi:hypothetical protein